MAVISLTIHELNTNGIPLDRNCVATHTYHYTSYCCITVRKSLNQGSDYTTQFQPGNGGLLGASYIQSLTPHFSLGGEVFWAEQHWKSGIGYAARYNTDKMTKKEKTGIKGLKQA
ncbi:hypothetical protein ACS0TY_019583 [Phlomoides rotata]